MSDQLPDVQYSTPQSSLPVYQSYPPQKSSNNGTRIVLGCLGASCLCICLVCCALPLTGTIGLGAIAAVFLSNGVSQTNTEAFRIEEAGNGVLQVNDSNTTVVVNVGTVEEIIVNYEITVYGWSESAAQDELSKYQVQVDRSGDTISLSVDDSQSGFSFYDMTATITVPADMQSITLNTDDPITIDGVRADFTLDSNLDSVTLRNVSGEFDVSAGSFGEINFTGTFAPKSINRFESSSGNINLTIQDAGDVDYTAQTGSLGDVSCPNQASSGTFCSGRLGDATAKLDLVSSSGDISLVAAR